MWNKIAFLCVTPWESFLPSMFQSCGREYYRWMKEQIGLQKVPSRCLEKLEVYGESWNDSEIEVFLESEAVLQLLYIQSTHEAVIDAVFRKADIVVMGLPGCKKEFDHIFMMIFPWKDRIKFFWNSHICRDEKFIAELCREYKLHEKQIFQIERGNDGKLKKLLSV